MWRNIPPSYSNSNLLINQLELIVYSLYHYSPIVASLYNDMLCFNKASVDVSGVSLRPLPLFIANLPDSMGSIRPLIAPASFFFLVLILHEVLKN